MKIKDLPHMERPYEKLELLGSEALSNAELLAIVLKAGTKNVTSVELAQEVLRLDEEEKGLSFLKNIATEELMKIDGLRQSEMYSIESLRRTFF